MKKKTLKERQEQATPELFNPKPDFVKPGLTITWTKPKRESSQIAAYAYDGEGKLYIKYVSASVYRYTGVSTGLFYTMQVVDNAQTESLGSWLYKHITGGDDNKRKFPFTKEN